MDKKEPASSSNSNLNWKKGFLNESKGQGSKETLFTLKGGLPQGSGVSPSAYYKLLESKLVTYLLRNFEALAKEAKEVENSEDKPIKEYKEQLKRAEENARQAGKELKESLERAEESKRQLAKELKESLNAEYTKPREDGGQSSQGPGP
jgi:hypothetical protein